MEVRSHYITMRDGVKIALTLFLPDQVARGERVPTVMCQTRYFRSIELRRGFGWLRGDGRLDHRGDDNSKLPRQHMLDHGYAWLDVDVRGSGASFGHRAGPWSPDEIRDGGEIVDWVVEQPWSNQRVGATGVSYDGTSADMLLLNGHPAVKAIAPRFCLFDVFADIAFPGGVRRSVFLDRWATSNRVLDANKPHKRAGWWAWFLVTGVSPVDEDKDRSMRARAVHEHVGNYDVDGQTRDLEYRDDVSPADAFRKGDDWDLDALAATPNAIQGSIDVFSPHSYLDALNKSGTPILSYGGWLDGAYANAAIKRFLNIRTPQSELMIGPWNHGGGWHYQPRGRPKRARFDHARELRLFFDAHLKETPPSQPPRHPVRYFTHVEERWKHAETWPPPQSTTEVWYFQPDKSLAPDSPPSRPPGASEVYRVDLTATSGKYSRWRLAVVDPVVAYFGRKREDRKLLVYQSSPLEHDVEVTGHPRVTLRVSADTTDAVLVVFLEDVHADGHVAYVTEGRLRALHRKSDDSRAPYKQLTPWQSCLRDDAQKLVPGEVAELEIGLLPTSYLFRKGHRLRIAIGGADVSDFPNSSGAPTVRLFTSDEHPSALHLPVVPAK